MRTFTIDPAEDFAEEGRKASKNYERWPNYVRWRGPWTEIMDRGQWYVSETHHRDSDSLTRSNAEVILHNMKPYLGDWEDDPEPQCVPDGSTCSLVGWRDGLAIRIFEADGVTTTPAWRMWCTMAKEIEDYPALDEDHWSELEYNEAWHWFEECVERMWRKVDDDGHQPDPSDVRDWLDENEPREMTEFGTEYGGPSDEAILRALEALAEGRKTA